jgi:hypothetical protein
MLKQIVAVLLLSAACSAQSHSTVMVVTPEERLERLEREVGELRLQLANQDVPAVKSIVPLTPPRCKSPASQNGISFSVCVMETEETHWTCPAERILLSDESGGHHCILLRKQDAESAADIVR